MASKKTGTGIVDFPVQKATKKPRIAFGSTLREYRLKAHLEQEQVGKACGVTGNAISNWERDVPEHSGQSPSAWQQHFPGRLHCPEV